MNSSTFLCSLGLLMVAGYASAGGVGTENDLGRCAGPQKCAMCPLTRERICVHPFANDEMIRKFCESEDKIHCISPRKTDSYSVAMNDDMGRCSMPLKCAKCPSGDLICVPPLANEALIQAYCMMEDKIQCFVPTEDDSNSNSEIKEMVTQDLGRCPGPNMCVECRRTRERICVPPLANEALIRQYCERKEKIHCITPHMTNSVAVSKKNDLGRCAGPLTCAMCPSGEKICVPPFANEELVKHYCEMKDKTHCFVPHSDYSISEVKEDEDLGRCPGPNVCVECRRTRERICVPPLANEALIRQYCERKEKIHCITPHMTNSLAVSKKNDLGRCAGPLTCAMCPSGEKICVPPFANEELIKQYCEKKEKIHCFVPHSDNSNNEKALAVVDNVQGTCPFPLYCKDCGGGLRVCCTNMIWIASTCCMADKSTC